jgi:two-component system, OmpR family, sensor kinase
MEAANHSLPQRLLHVLEGLLRIPAGDMRSTLVHVCDLIAAATGADKMDAFLYDPSRDSLVAVGTSNQPLSALQRKLGLDVLALSNGGRTVQVYKDGKTYLNGNVGQDTDELKGVKEALGIKSEIGVPFDVGGERRGMLMAASQKPDYFTAEDARMAETVARWVGTVVHRAELVEHIRRNAAEQGRRAGAEELVTTLAHDLRNFLTPIGLRLDLMRRRAEKEKRADDLADMAVVFRSIGRLDTLISDLLDVSRLDQGVFELHPAPLDMAALVRECAAMLATPPHPVEVSVQQGEPMSLAVTGDASRLRQCVENLIANAVQKSPNHAEVTVTVAREQQADGAATIVVDVVDEGPGIPPDVMPFVFDRFYTSRPGREGGLGLGLYLARRIAALHGGELSVESEPGRGARFTLRLPASPASAQESP